MSPTKKDKCTIHDSELAKWFSITLDRLDEIVQFFDSDPDDEWDLVQGEDYRFINRTKGKEERIFSPTGALKIATYLDQYEKRGLWYTIKDFIIQHDERLRKSLALRLIHQELTVEGNLKTINGLLMMHRQSLRRILETSGSRLNKAIHDLQRAPIPLEKRRDYEEIEGAMWFASSGSEKIAKELGEKLKNKSRRKMCLAIGGQIGKSFKLLESSEKRRQKEINQAKKQAKKRDRNTCQVTSKKPGRGESKYYEMVAHHLYCEKKYPHLAAVTENLITLEKSVHKEFHGWMGGTDKSCTLDDFLEFLNKRYGGYNEDDREQVEEYIHTLSLRLHQLKAVLKVEDDK